MIMQLQSRAKATRGKAGTAGADLRPVRRSTAGTGLQVGEASAVLPATSEFMDATAGETATSFDSANSISVIGSARGTSAMLHPGVVDGSTASLAGRDSGDSRRDGNQFSSSDGLGNHQPGSMTWGGVFIATAPSGRASPEMRKVLGMDLMN